MGIQVAHLFTQFISIFKYSRTPNTAPPLIPYLKEKKPLHISKAQIGFLDSPTLPIAVQLTKQAYCNWLNLWRRKCEKYFRLIPFPILELYCWCGAVRSGTDLCFACMGQYFCTWNSAFALAEYQYFAAIICALGQYMPPPERIRFRDAFVFLHLYSQMERENDTQYEIKQVDYTSFQFCCSSPVPGAAVLGGSTVHYQRS